MELFGYHVDVTFTILGIVSGFAIQLIAHKLFKNWKN
jgi:hypothetical protein